MIIKTEFQPNINGYPFPNRFEKNWLNIFIRVTIGNSIYGLCGGMVFSALDYYYNKVDLPLINSEDTERYTQFVHYLWRRQLNSMPLKNYYDLLTRNFSKDNNLLIGTISRQLPKVTQSIDAGIPCPLVIIRSSKFENLTNNHQLVITGYEIDNSVTNLFCYDPNHPGETPSIMISRDINALSIKQSTFEAIRGFFCNHYKIKPPFSAD
ncbi:MAG: hypothetical protein BGO78_01420 [Chloroflexi bacterium 44-23]|nr:MAG: hypothetical protein BGO78_01420 [Chloroflexi bacterium 44-23]